jgi:hypothetical protein
MSRTSGEWVIFTALGSALGRMAIGFAKHLGVKVTNRAAPCRS